MLSLSPNHRYYRTKVKETTDPVEIEIAKQRFLLTSKRNNLMRNIFSGRATKTVKKSSRIAKYVTAFRIRSTGRICHLVKTE